MRFNAQVSQICPPAMNSWPSAVPVSTREPTSSLSAPSGNHSAPMERAVNGPGTPEWSDQSIINTQHGCRSHWIVKTLVLHVQIKPDSYQHNSALKVSQLRANARVHSMWHSQPRNAPLPQPHKGLKQLNLLFVTEEFIFPSYKYQQKVASPYQSTRDPPVRSWAAGKDSRNGNKQPSLENLAHLNLLKPREEWEVTWTPAYITAQGVNGMGSWDRDKLKIKINHIQKK